MKICGVAVGLQRALSLFFQAVSRFSTLALERPGKGPWLLVQFARPMGPG